MRNLKDELKQYIATHYDGSYWEVMEAWFRDGNAWELMCFSERVTYENEDYQVTIIEKWNLATDDHECVEDSETVYMIYEKY